ncbi:MAG: acetyl-CoA synthetase, partial [Methanopyri archaeon]|nr:acetyl-CoA synthetase [Methanopyri archaeon]
IDHGTVSEAAAFGVHDETTGEAIVCFAVLRPGSEPSDDLRKDLREHVGDILGKPFRPKNILFVEALPKTRSGKIVRRTIKNIYIGSGPVGDVSTLENPEALDGIRKAV